jgi:hypothetical protein
MFLPGGIVAGYRPQMVGYRPFFQIPPLTDRVGMWWFAGIFAP